MADILVVDDDETVATALERVLRFERHTHRMASNAVDAMLQMEERLPDLVLMDVRMPGIDGLDALQRMRRQFPDVYVVMMTAFGTSQTSIDAIRAGAFDYITKPLDLPEIRDVIDRALAAQRIRDQATAPAAAPRIDPALRLVGDAPGMLEMYKLIGTLSTTDVPALVTGERGTGKRLVVETIHANSWRGGRPCVSLDCGLLQPAAFARALGANDGATLHLSGIDRLSPDMQVQLAGVVSDDRMRQGSEPRVLASTEVDLASLVAAGTFSRELYESLTVVVVRVPALRERRDDIPLLVRHFVHRYNEQLSREIKGVDQQVMQRLRDDEWPGNVGELERTIKRAVIVTRSDVITLADLIDGPASGRALPAAGSVGLAEVVRKALHDRLLDAGAADTPVFHDIVDEVETLLVAEALTITTGNQVKAAEILGVNRTTLRKKMPQGPPGRP